MSSKQCQAEANLSDTVVLFALIVEEASVPGRPAALTLSKEVGAAPEGAPPLQQMVSWWSVHQSPDTQQHGLEGAEALGPQKTN